METGIQKFRGIDDKYIYELEKTKETKNVKRDIIFNLFGGELRIKALEEANYKGLDIDEEEYHIINIMLAKKYRYKYRRIKNEK